MHSRTLTKIAKLASTYTQEILEHGSEYKDTARGIAESVSASEFANMISTAEIDSTFSTYTLKVLASQCYGNQLIEIIKDFGLESKAFNLIQRETDSRLLNVKIDEQYEKDIIKAIAALLKDLKVLPNDIVLPKWRNLSNIAFDGIKLAGFNHIDIIKSSDIVNMNAFIHLFKRDGLVNYPDVEEKGGRWFTAMPFRSNTGIEILPVFELYSGVFGRVEAQSKIYQSAIQYGCSDNLLNLTYLEKNDIPELLHNLRHPLSDKNLNLDIYKDRLTMLVHTCKLNNCMEVMDKFDVKQLRCMVKLNIINEANCSGIEKLYEKMKVKMLKSDLGL